jgi:pre-mRNA-splicing helicase BRR2
MWETQCPLRQITSVPDDLVRRLEKKDLDWDRICDMDAFALGELLAAPRMGNKIHKWVHQVPRIDVSGRVQTVSRSVVRVELALMCDFAWDDAVHGSAQPFWVWVEDGDGETLLHQEYIVLRRRHCSHPHTISFILPVFEPLPPHYFVRVTSDKWIGCETVLPVSFSALTLPDRFPPLTQLLDLAPQPVAEGLQNERLLRYMSTAYPHIAHFNPIQTQCFSTVFGRDDNVLVCAPEGSGKTLIAELAIMRHYTQLQALRRAQAPSDEPLPHSRIVYVVPYLVQARAVHRRWASGLCEALDMSCSLLTGDVAADLEIGAHSDVIVATAEHWDVVSRRWQSRVWLQQVRLLIVDDLQMLASDGVGACQSDDQNLGLDGTLIESVVTRTKYMAMQLEERIRIIGLSASIANGKNIADWIGTKNAFCFHPSARPVPLATQVRALQLESHTARQRALYPRLFRDIVTLSPQGPALVFVAGAEECVATAQQLIRAAESIPYSPQVSTPLRSLS